jgi:hypothetical protein
MGVVSGGIAAERSSFTYAVSAELTADDENRQRRLTVFAAVRRND